MLKLAKNHHNILLSQPESGMGYQFVEIAFRSREKTKLGVVYNAETLVYLNEVAEFNDIRYASQKYFLREDSTDELYDIKDLTVIPKYSFLKTGFIAETKGAACESPIEYTRKGEIFKRFSAYRHDNRVTSEGGLLPGTYATTAEDAVFVKTGVDAVVRYALPNNRPAIYVFTIVPLKDTEVKRGIVQPSNKKHGGGIELLFTKGSASKTVRQPYKIPER